MLNSIRKFSSSPYAKVLMGIVILPFVMWGMGDVFRGGKQNTIVEIDKKKISAQDFGDYINSLNVSYEDVKKEDTFNKILSNFIARQLIAADSKKLKINVSDQSLAKMIQNNESFKKDKKFSRTKYEKFLLSSNLTAFQFEQGLTENEIKDQLLKFISGGIKSPEFLINRQYDLKNQIRNILVVDLNDIYKKKLIFSDDEIKNYYDNNISAFSEEYRSIKYSTLTPSTLTGKEEFSNSFFEALDEIEDSIISDVGIENISKKFGLQIKEVKLFNIKGKKANGSSVDNSLSDIINKIFKINLSDPLVLINQNENYLMVSLEEIKKVPENIDSEKIINEISSKLKRLTISKENSNLIEKIITNKFVKTDFDN